MDLTITFDMDPDELLEHGCASRKQKKQKKNRARPAAPQEQEAAPAEQEPQQVWDGIRVAVALASNARKLGRYRTEHWLLYGVWNPMLPNGDDTFDPTQINRA
jgi:hypothetical protein